MLRKQRPNVGRLETKCLVIWGTGIWGNDEKFVGNFLQLFTGKKTENRFRGHSNMSRKP